MTIERSFTYKDANGSGFKVSRHPGADPEDTGFLLLDLENGEEPLVVDVDDLQEFISALVSLAEKP